MSQWKNTGSELPNAANTLFMFSLLVFFASRRARFTIRSCLSSLTPGDDPRISSIVAGFLPSGSCPLVTVMFIDADIGVLFNRGFIIAPLAQFLAGAKTTISHPVRYYHIKKYASAYYPHNFRRFQRFNFFLQD